MQSDEIHFLSLCYFSVRDPPSWYSCAQSPPLPLPLDGAAPKAFNAIKLSIVCVIVFYPLGWWSRNGDDGRQIPSPRTIDATNDRRASHYTTHSPLSSAWSPSPSPSFVVPINVLAINFVCASLHFICHFTTIIPTTTSSSSGVLVSTSSSVPMHAGQCVRGMLVAPFTKSHYVILLRFRSDSDGPAEKSRR